MTSRFDDRFHGHALPVLNREHSVQVALSNGIISTAEFTARRSDRTHRALGQEYGLEVKVSIRDYTLLAASVVVDGTTIEPRTGYRITEGDETFEIQPPDDDTPSVEKMTGGYEWLVHTKRIE
jgi:hypothetical protein